MSTLKALARMVEPLTPGMPGDSAYERFAADPLLPLLPVVDGSGRPVGLIERNAFLTRFGGHYGRATYGRRPVTLLMESEPLTVEASVQASDFATLALSDADGRQQLSQGFIVLDGGIYAGVGLLTDLLRATMDERARAMSALSELAADLRVSNFELDRHRRLVDAVIEHMPLLVAVRAQRDGRILLINRIGATMLGATPESLIGRLPGAVAPSWLGRQLARAARHLAGPAAGRDVRFRSIPGAPPRVLHMAQVPIANGGGEPLMLVVAEDVTEIRRSVSRIAELAHFDSLTGLPNRAQWQQRLTTLCGEAVPELALLAIDLDRFKPVNDTWGHGVGDAVLREVSRRLAAVVRPGDMAARLGGDEFAIIVGGPDATVTAMRTADAVIAAIQRPFHVDGRIVQIGASIGMAVVPEDCAGAADLIRDADLALYRAKADGKGVWRRFSAEVRAAVERRQRLEEDLRHALDNGEVSIHVQPQFSLIENRINGFECLMRWHHPEFGAIPPTTFIPIAEEAGLIGPLGEWAIRRACMLAAQLPEDITVAVNVSGSQFGQPGLVACVAQALAQAGIAPERLELEITESVLMAEGPQALRNVGLLRDLGVRLALDDFGTGYASFAYLQRFAFDRLKLDRSFVEGLPEARTSRAIVASMVVLARELGAAVTAEGVETEAQIAALRELGCADVQGYLIGEPAADPFLWLPPEPIRIIA